MPPDAETVALPFVEVEQFTPTILLIESVGAPGAVIEKFSIIWHPSASVIVTVPGPAANPVAEEVVLAELDHTNV